MPQLSEKERGAIESFKAKAREFWRLWNSLSEKKALAENDPELKKEYSELMEQGITIKNGVEKITGIIDRLGRTYDNVKGWLKETFGLGEVESAYKAQLGVIPLVPIAAIGVSLAAMGKWMADAYKLDRKLDEIERLEKRGLSPSEAAKVVNKVMDKGFFNTGFSKLPLLVGGGIAAFALYKFLTKR